MCRIKESAMDVEVFQGLEIVGSLNHSQAWRGKWRNGIITTEWCLELRLTQVRRIMRQNNLATSKKKKKKAGKEIFLLYFYFSFLFHSSAWISHWQNPIESQRVRAWVMLSNWYPYQGRIGDRMNWGSEKQPPRWLPTITASWYSFPCVSSLWIKAGHCHTLLMNRMWLKWCPVTSEVGYKKTALCLPHSFSVTHDLGVPIYFLSLKFCLF